jgi:hypothetical protein
MRALAALSAALLSVQALQELEKDKVNSLAHGRLRVVEAVDDNSEADTRAGAEGQGRRTRRGVLQLRGHSLVGHLPPPLFSAGQQVAEHALAWVSG